MWIPSKEWQEYEDEQYRQINTSYGRPFENFLARWNSVWDRPRYGNTEIYLDNPLALNFKTIAILYGAEYRTRNKKQSIDGSKSDVYWFESWEDVKECLLKFEELCSPTEKQK